LDANRLIGGERQVRVIAGNEAVLEQRLQLLDQVGPHEIVRHAVQDIREQAARQVGISLDLLRHHRNVAEREPPERVIEADAPPVRNIDG